MKKANKYISMLSIAMLASGSFIPTALATNEMQAQEAATSESKKKTIDITPQFDMTDPFKKGIEVGSTGVLDIKLKDIQGLDKLEGKTSIKVANKEILSINEKKEWKALKSGKTDVLISCEYSEDTMKRFKEKYPDAELENKKEPLILKVEVKAAPTEEDKKPITPVDKNKVKPSIKIVGLEPVVAVDTEGQIKLEVKDDYQIEGLDGAITYKVDKEDILTIDKTGKWNALKEGKAVVDVTFEYSEESMKKIKEKYPNEKNIERTIAQKMEVEVKPELRKAFEPDYDFSKMPKEVVIGTKGTFEISLKELEGYEILSANYTFEDNVPNFLKVDEKGNWEAIAEGEVEVPFNVNVKYGLKPIGDETVTSLAYEETFKSTYKLKVVANTGPTTDIRAETPAQKKNLPQTGEKDSYGYLILGTFLVGASVYVAMQRKQKA